MNRPALLASLVLAATMLAAGCGSAASQAAAPARPATPPSLATSLATATGTWAVAVMGGSAASHNNFWQLFVRPAGASTWRLATPPGVASNGGLVLTGLASGSVLAGFRPSQDLAYSPLATTKDNGKAWSPGLLDAGLADVPGALAADPASGRLLALLANGTTDISGTGGTRWTRLVTRRELAASPAGRRCQPAASPRPRSARPGSLAGRGLRPSRNRRDLLPNRPDVAAHRTRATRCLRPPGHHRPAAHDQRPYHHGPVWRRNRARGTPPSRWLADSGAHWTLSPPLPLNGATLTSASSGPGSSLAITLSDRRAAAITTAPGPWQQLPVLPPGTVTLGLLPQADGMPWPFTAPSSPSGRPCEAPMPGPAPRSSRFDPVRLIRVSGRADVSPNTRRRSSAGFFTGTMPNPPLAASHGLPGLGCSFMDLLPTCT